MDLHSGQPYWQVKSGLLGVYPSLKHDEVCDVAILGGGITGALVAYYLASEGVDVVVIDKRDLATGSTAACTGLLQYEIDTELHELQDRIGDANAVRCYRLGVEAISTIGDLVTTLNGDCGFEREPSLYLASRNSHIARLRHEHQCREAMGLDVEFLDHAAVHSRYSLDAPGAIVSYDNAKIDPYRFTHLLAREAVQRGTRVYDRSLVTDVIPSASKVELHVEGGHSISTQRVVIAAGYETQKYLKQRVGDLNSTYALISEPIEDFGTWTERCMIWETARPYFYACMVNHHRVILGGQDTNFSTDHRRDRLIEKKTAALVKRFRQMFPGIEMEVAYAWAGTFGESKDGLPYIGETNEFPRAYFALGYGGNGMTAGVIAAQIIRDLYLGRPNADAQLFRFDR